VNDQQAQSLAILQEEAAEVIVAASKIIRFGSSSANIDRLTTELGDLLDLIDIVIDRFDIAPQTLSEAKKRKTEKLKVYSTLFADNCTYSTIDDWLNELESFGHRSDRLHDQFGDQTKAVRQWIEAAWSCARETN